MSGRRRSNRGMATRTIVLLVGVALAACGVQPAPPALARTTQQPVPYEQQNDAYRWLDIMQEAAAREVERIGAQPTVLSHQMMIWAVAMFDAWAISTS